MVPGVCAPWDLKLPSKRNSPRVSDTLIFRGEWWVMHASGIMPDWKAPKKVRAPTMFMLMASGGFLPKHTLGHVQPCTWWGQFSLLTPITWDALNEWHPDGCSLPITCRCHLYWGTENIFELSCLVSPPPKPLGRCHNKRRMQIWYHYQIWWQIVCISHLWSNYNLDHESPGHKSAMVCVPGSLCLHGNSLPNPWNL